MSHPQSTVSPRRSRRKPNFEEINEVLNPQRKWLRPITASLMYGFSRTRLYMLIADGTLESKLIQRPGTKRGTRLIRASSLEAYLNSFDAEGSQQKEVVTS